MKMIKSKSKSMSRTNSLVPTLPFGNASRSRTASADEQAHQLSLGDGADAERPQRDVPTQSVGTRETVEKSLCLASPSVL
jgi:hypothetical protein